MKKNLFLLALLAMLIGFGTSCSDDDDNIISKELTLTVASTKSIMPIYNYAEPYFVKYEGDSKWYSLQNISGFEHTEGYEYVIRVRQDYDKSLEGTIGGSLYSYYLLEVISKTEKYSENIPLQRRQIIIVTTETDDPHYPYYAYSSVTGTFVKFHSIEGFEYEKGYQYNLKIDCKYNGVEGMHKYTYIYVETVSKEKLKTENLPG